MFWKSTFLGLLLLSGLGHSACAQAQGQEADEYRLEAGDTIELWSAQEPVLRRAVVVAPDGRISLPLAGHVLASGQSLPDLESGLRERLRPFFKEEPDLTVMLQPRPDRVPMIFVAGDVTMPGAFPYRGGMTVLHGVSVAGGLYRLPMAAADQDRSVIVRREVESAQSRLREVDVQIARLQAELNGQTTLPAQTNAAGDPIVAQEQQVLDARNAELAVQTTAAAQVEQFGTRGKAALQEEAASLDQRIALTKRRLESTKTLVNKGFANGSLQIELEAQVAELEGNRSQLLGEMARNDASTVAEKARLDGLLQARRSQLVIDLRNAERDRDATRSRLQDNTNIMAIYEQTASTQRNAAQRHVDYTVIRQVDGVPHEVAASEMTPIMPGDLIRVRFSAGGVEQSSSAAPSSTLASGEAAQASE